LWLRLTKYRLTLPTAYRFLVFGVMTLMSLVGFGIVVSAIRGSSQGPPLPFALLWCGAVAWNWYVLLGVPYEIRFDSDNRISFVSLARTTTLTASDIRSIKPYGGGVGFYVLRHDGGKIRLLSQFTGFHEVVSRIKRANPRFETVGI
jgi:hypothetical protein